MQAAFLIVLMGGLFGGSSGARSVHVYYGAEFPTQVGSITVRSQFTNASTLVCEDGYRASFNSFERVREEMERTMPRGEGLDRNQVMAKSKKYRRDFPVPRKAIAIDVPKCAIVWPSGVFREIPAFSVDVSGAKFPLEVTKDVERVMSGDNAADVQDGQAAVAAIERYAQDVERMRVSRGALPQPPMPSSQPAPVYAPVYVPSALPTMPSVSPPGAPGRTTTVCRTLSNGTIVCN